MPEMEKVASSSMAEAVISKKSEQQTWSACATDPEGGSIEKQRGAYRKITPKAKLQYVTMKR